MVFKCKMCGGDLNLVSNDNICICPYCKSKQTIPNINNEKEQQLFDRANYYRFSNDFDRALSIYEQILVINSKESEAYWGILLCRYGVEYVDDPVTKAKIPTCHRTCYDSILNDMNYKMVLDNASIEAKKIYEEEAVYIDNVQKRIKEISSRESPFDIFICYKESNDNDRTIDSVIAEDIYNSLCNKGYKVFFARITLEGKLGVEYEPYIYAALTSSKVMLVVGTTKDNMNAIWVKNEWSRYLSLIKEGKDKFLIPCYKDMNPYDMPEEFSALQAQDMGKVGAMQDLLRGIDKIIKPTTSDLSGSTVESHIFNKSLENAFEYLKQRKWNEAEKRLDNAKDYDVRSAFVYLGYLLIDLRLTSVDELGNYPYDYFNNENYKLVLNYADNDLKGKLEKYKENTEKLIEEKNRIQKEELEKRRKRITIGFIVMFLFFILGVIIYNVILKIIVPNIKYNDAISLMNEKRYEDAYEMFKNMYGVKDSEEKIDVCVVQIQLGLIDKDINANLDKRFSDLLKELDKKEIYTVAKKYYDGKNYDAYQDLFNYIKGYEDSDLLYSETLYQYGLDNYKEGNVKKALVYIGEAIEYGNKDAVNKIEEIKKEIYDNAEKEYKKTNYATAKEIYALIRGYDYKDSKSKYDSCVDKIKKEKQAYNGVWLEANGFWSNLKFDDYGVYYADQVDTKRDKWTVVSSSYDENTGKYTITFFTGNEYEVKLSGNMIKLVWTNPIDEYDNDWIGENNIFYRK